MPLLRTFFIITISLLVGISTEAQLYKVRGTVYDSTRTYPVESVSVLSSSGRGTFTDSEGKYEIDVNEKDSIWFSYLNKPTIKFPVLKIQNPMAFDISIQVNIPVLKEVRIKQKNYKLDSIQNRIDYAKIFNYQKPRIKTVTPQYGVGAGFDLDELINMFRFKRNKSMAAFQKRLLQEERDKFIEHRFNKLLVRRLTQLDGKDLDSFMLLYRPTYTFTLAASEYDFQLYIKQAGDRYKSGQMPDPFLKKEDELP